ncbi:MAG: hypothetical protein HGA45_28955 [Chloroflexales bacterium]|nr:hypothetical protein [Chloroflexales bacterium]
MPPRRFVFNPPAASVFTSTGATRYLSSNEPTIVLEETLSLRPAHIRHAEQQGALPALTLPEDAARESALVGNDLSLFCREYLVRRVWVDDEHEREELDDVRAPLGNAPPRLLSNRPVATDRLMQALGRPSGIVEPGAEVLYLFNVIVALEWVPTPQRLRRLQWAFRRASDYLYDVTNGGMAFGQVVFAGPAWMRGADIQILASNRFLPRSWVSGLLEGHKYTPIRLGRGLWVRDRRIVVDWDEPEGYRAIVHEWAHYALGLKDEYMHVQEVYLDAVNNRLYEKAPSTESARLEVVLPSRRVKSESIMASVQGNSELPNPLPSAGRSHANLSSVIDRRYPHLRDRLRRPWSGPGRLPLPLPHFRLAGELAEQVPHTERSISIPFALGAPQRVSLEAASAPVISLDNDTIPQGRWEVFLMRFLDGKPTRLVYQGEIDARSPEQGFTLLGAAPGDTVLLVGSDDLLSQIWARDLDALEPAEDRLLISYRWLQLEAEQGRAMRLGANPAADSLSATVVELLAKDLRAWRAPVPPATPIEAPDVLPVAPKEAAKTRALVSLRGSGEGAGLEHAVFGIGDAAQAPVPEVEGAFRLPSLDGYVVTTLSQDAGVTGQPRLVISDFSQGGPPATAPTMVSDPISAGAASGEALIICDVQDQSLDTAGYRVITTALRGAQLSAAKALSPIYSVATNIPLLKSFSPTLLIVNALPDDGSLDDVWICRVEGEGLVRLPTYIGAGGGAALTPLSADSGSTLVVDAPTPPEPAAYPLIERFVLARMAASAPDGGGGDVRA